MSTSAVDALVAAAGAAARAAGVAMASADAAAVAHALDRMADRLEERAGALLEANGADVAAGEGVLPDATVDRLRLDDARLARMAEQIRALARVDDPAPVVGVRELAGGLRVEERRRPVGVIGANYEARPNVTVDIASQLVKSRNAGVLRTGAAALASAGALIDEVVQPALREAGLDPDAIQLLRTPERAAALALVRMPALIPLVILRGSGETTARLAREAAIHGVRTLAHAEGGGVLYLDRAADADRALDLVARSLDRLGVCNRLNLLLIAAARWDELVPRVVERLASLGIAPSLPPHPHPLGFEWALAEGREATVTLAPAGDALEAARVANEETSGLAAAIATEDPEAAAVFIGAYAGTGVFWNATTRLLDGFELLGAPETGINVDRVPGPRGPVTFHDLHLRQLVVVPTPP